MTETPEGDDPGSGEPESACDRCGGEPLRVRSGGVTVLECDSCGNVLGLAEERSGAGAAGEGRGGSDGDDCREGVDRGADGAARFDEVTAADGDLGQLVTLLRAEAAAGDPVPAITTGRLLLSTEATTLEVRAADGDLEVAEVDRTDD